MIEKIIHNDALLSIIIRRNFEKDGLEFFTPDEFSQQLAYMKYPAGKIIQTHIHNKISRDVNYTQEVLIIKRGKIRIDFYDELKNYLQSRILEAGDIVLLAAGGHGIEVLEELEMVEVKQGPYVEGDDKILFEGITAEQVIMKKNDNE
ncbi:MAG: hypothetical protein HOI47_00095 [Candidatus Scalindua sp.]|jgi:hypothetical protein|nr:hypothetical protein [Candidatus Scalindua sp.]